MRRLAKAFSGKVPARMNTQMSSTLAGRLRPYTAHVDLADDSKVSAVPEEIFDEVERTGRIGRPGAGGGMWVGPWKQIKGCLTQADFERTLGVKWKPGLKRVYIVKLVEPKAHLTTKPTGQEQGTNELFGKTNTEEEFVHGQVPRWTGYMPSSQEGIERFWNVEVKEMLLK